MCAFFSLLHDLLVLPGTWSSHQWIIAQGLNENLRILAKFHLRFSRKSADNFRPYNLSPRKFLHVRNAARPRKTPCSFRWHSDMIWILRNGEILWTIAKFFSFANVEEGIRLSHFSYTKVLVIVLPKYRDLRFFVFIFQDGKVLKFASQCILKSLPHQIRSEQPLPCTVTPGHKIAKKHVNIFPCRQLFNPSCSPFNGPGQLSWACPFNLYKNFIKLPRAGRRTPSSHLWLRYQSVR